MKMKTFILTWLPIAMTTIGGVWLAIRQVNESNADGALARETNELAKKSFDLSLDQAARSGNEQLKQEIIALRSKAALAGSEGRTGDLKKILSDLPQLIDNQKRLNEQKKQNVETLITDMELSWTPFLSLTLAVFDQRVVQLQEAGNGFKSNLQHPLPKIAVEENKATRVRLRELIAANGKATILVEFKQGAVSPYGMRAAVLEFEVYSATTGLDDNPFRIYLDFNQASLAEFPDKKPADGMPTEAMKSKMQVGVAKTIERYLVLSGL